MDELAIAMKAREFIARVGPSALPVSVQAYVDHIGGVLQTEPLGEGEDAWSFRKPNGQYCICVN